MRKLQTTLLFLIYLGTSALSPTGHAQAFSLTGQIVEAGSGEPLVGAYVYPLANPGQVQTTDPNGQFTLELTTPDSLRVSYLGYVTLTQWISGARDSLLLSLRPTAAASLEGVTVRAAKIAYGELASTRINQLDVYLNPAAKADPLLAVNSLPAATNPDETANVSLRGSPSEATGIFLNDVPIRSAVRIDQSNGVGQFSIFGQIPLRDVRVYSANPPVNFSQSSAGAVALYTSPELPNSTTYGLSLNLAGFGLAHARPIGQKSGLRAFLNFSNLAAFRGINATGLPELQASRAIDAALQFVHQTGDDAHLQVFYLGFDERYRFTTQTTYYEGEFSQHKPRHLGIVNWTRKRGNWTWTLNQSVDWEHADFSLGNIATSPRRRSVHTAHHGRLERPGFTFQHGTLLNAYDDKVFGTFPLQDHRIAPEDEFGSYRTQTANQVLETYVYGQWRLGERWLWGAGAKLLRRLNTGVSRPVLQSTLRYRPGEHHRFNLGGGYFSQLLSPGPEVRDWQWLNLRQLVLEYQYARDNWTVNAATYAKREQYGVLDDVGVRGAEASVQYRDGSWMGWLSGALVRSRELTSSAPTARDLPWLVRAQLQWKNPDGWTLGVAGNFRRGSFFLPVIGTTPIPGTAGWQSPILGGPAAGRRYPDYARVDASLSRVIIIGKSQLILYANVNNLLNRENIRAYRYDPSFSERNAEVYSRRLVFFGGVWRR
ncbi:carboxypeptidase-like regulatory domain-containing protein [Lewinella sp. W8]|uniref:carboxypeptidase-like regulatory domain-containing protein n=1 Tax=Lewinella sp. W8 TaxID=2528208 RepID=UPI00106754E2|nr:carboxypeptidase-like regulatory domain-containing protein [Lewinella sp. W8]MTB52576.1 hypothetical protein [Lewinella sp. W8]